MPFFDLLFDLVSDLVVDVFFDLVFDLFFHLVFDLSCSDQTSTVKTLKGPACQSGTESIKEKQSKLVSDAFIFPSLAPTGTAGGD